MSITRDTYLFEPKKFAAYVLPYAKAIEQGAGRQEIHKAAIERFEQSTIVRALALDAGWDIWSIYEGSELKEPSSAADIAKWIVFLLYDHLVPMPTELRLAKWWLMDDILRDLNWHDTDRSLLIHGHSFGYFAQVWIAQKLETGVYPRGDLQYWEYVRPITTLAQIGWLDNVDVQRLLSKLTRDQSSLIDIDHRRAHTALVNEKSIQESYQATLEIMRYASTAHAGLCVLTSG